jgi:NADH-quinone oxidoreductase subunit F
MQRLALADLEKIKEEYQAELSKDDKRIRVTVHMGTCGIAAGAKDIMLALEDEIKRKSLKNVIITSSGCAGLCSREPIISVEQTGCEPVKYCDLNTEKTKRIVSEHFIEDNVVLECALPPQSDVPFFNLQKLRVLRNTGFIDPENMHEYIARDGYRAAAKALTEMSAEEIINVMKDSGLRGRGGAGFPTGLKWEFCSKVASDVKYMLCNGDEGDPGAFMDRSVMEADPHSVIEGMIIGAKAIGSHQGYIYVRAEYPLAVKRLQLAIQQCYESGLLGKNILDSGFDFDLEIYLGAGAFVCGEETALMRSLEGKRGMPRSRPPFPAHKGLWDKPSVLNNVETLAQVSLIILNGADWYKSLGTEKSSGTKVFALTGAINNIGLVEVPMGIKLRRIIYDIGGGIKNNRKFKAVQMGGPSGGCVPASLLDIPVTYEDIVKTGAIMGSGGMVVMDDTNCMVNVARFFLGFTTDESCGKCSPCRMGTKVMLEILNRITRGEGREGDIERLLKLGDQIKDASLCGLGKTCSNPILTTIRYFRNEYEEHIKYKRCNSLVCKEIISSPCQYTCPIGTEVPVYVALIAQGKFNEALYIIKKDNPLPSVCGSVCSHPCEYKCKLGDVDEPIAIRALKRFATDFGLKTPDYVKPIFTPDPPKNKKVAIIGSGPAGLAASNSLALKGYDVTVFEAKPVIGGMLRVALPQYRLPREKLDADIEAIKNAGVKFKTKTALGKKISIDSLFNDGYKAIFISVGAHKPMNLNIPGEKAKEVLPSLKFLEAVNLKKTLKVGKRIGIIGGGNSAIDSARAALRLKGTKKVIVIYRRTRTEMPAYKEEVDAAIEEGIDMQFLTAPGRIIKKKGKFFGVECIRMELAEPDESGRRKPVPVKGSEFVIELDNLIRATGEEPDVSFLRDQGLEISARNTLSVDPETLTTSREGVFAGGDAVTGPKTVIHAISAGKRAAESIDKYLSGESLQRDYTVTRPSLYIEPVELTDDEIESATRCTIPQLTVKERVHNFKEIDLGFSEETAVREARRCLRCDLGTEDGINALERIRREKQADAESIGVCHIATEKA